MGYRREVVDDLTDASRGFGFFTFIAGTDVLGVRLAMDGHHTVTAVLLAVAALTWIVLGYVVRGPPSSAPPNVRWWRAPTEPGSSGWSPPSRWPSPRG